jgi:Tol biopolymer transport system component
VRIELPSKPADFIANPPMAADKTPLVAEGRPTVYEIDASGFTGKSLTDRTSMSDLVVSPDGKWAAVTVNGSEIDPDSPSDGEIAVVDVETGALRLLTRNARRDDDPHFTADSKFVVFDTRVEMPRSDWTITAARIVPTGG